MFPFFCRRQRTFNLSFFNIWFETVSWWNSASGEPALRWLSCSLWSSSSSSTLCTAQTIKPLSLSMHIQQHRSSFGPLASVILFFRSLPTTGGHRWGSGGRTTGKSRALRLGSAPSLAPQTETHCHIDPLKTPRHLNPLTWSCFPSLPWSFLGLELHFYSLTVADIRGVLTLKCWGI